MKSLKKLFLHLGLCTMIITMLTTMTANPVLAKTNSSKDEKLLTTLQTKIDISGIQLGGKVILPDGAILTPITKDQYVSILAKEKNISIEEAYEMEARDSESLSVSAQALSSDIIYYNYRKDFTYSQNSSFKASLRATIKLYSSGSFRSIQNVQAVYSRREAGTYEAIWVETSAWSDPSMDSSLFPTTSVTLGADGYFEITSSYSIDVSVDLPGFGSIGGSGGGNYVYQSESMPMLGSYQLY